MKSALSLLCFVLALPLSSRAWNAEGHMVVAQIAYNHLTPAVKAQCDALIAVTLANASNGTSNFVTAAVWADDFRTPLGTAIWHYIDIPFSLDGAPTNGVPAASFDVVRAISLCITNLQNPTNSTVNKAANLRYLLHFVGDIQQPLHCSTEVTLADLNGDAGGNTFFVQDWGNLHSLWDSGGGYISDSLPRPLSAASQNTLNNRVATIEANHPYNYTTNVGTIPNPMNWAVEGWQLAQTVCYANIAPNDVPSAGYYASTYATTEERLAAGGHRLADLLNTIFSTNAVTLATVARTGSNFSFSWPGLYGRNYQVQWKTNLTDANWNNLTTITPTANQTVTFTESLNQARRFYRVVQ